MRRSKAVRDEGNEARFAVFWILAAAAAVAALSGYLTGSYRTRNEAWTIDLFSEYDRPRPLYSHLLESKHTYLSMNRSVAPPLWDPPSQNGWRPCLDDLKKPPITRMSKLRYFQVLCGGGLFQLHICVCNAVAVAKFLNATLVIPYFKLHPFWNDPSQFEDIYDVDHFISSLKGHVQVATELPAMLSWSRPEYYWNRCLERSNCVTFLPKHTTLDWFISNVVPIYESHSVAAVDGFEHKLTFEGLPADITRLRCKANFYSLRFVQPIRELGEVLTMRMRSKTNEKHSLSSWWSSRIHRFGGVKQNSTPTIAAGHYIGLHVRFERDMIAYSSCDYGGGLAEHKALSSFRYHMWSNRVARAQQKPENLRRNGSCPLTPEEMGLLLCAFGFTQETPVYIAGKELYGGASRMKPLKDLFPRFENKYSLATKQELSSLRKFAHKLTALDFTVLLNSDVFMSNAAGNFPNVLTGHRSFFGPRTSIHPDKAYLSALLENGGLDWPSFAEKAVSAHRSRMGAIELRRFRYSVFRFPAPDCMCLDSAN